MSFKKYRRTNIAEMRPYVKGEDLSGISVSKEDNPEEDMGMIARNPDNHNDQWYVNRKYFEKNFALLDEPTKEVISISGAAYNRLLEIELEFHALQEAGVDNWEGYSYAMELMRDRMPVESANPATDQHE